MAPLMAEVGKRFSGRHPGVQVEVRTGGSGRGISDARRGAVDIGMASRALNDQERDLVGLPVARDGVCLLVHRDNPVKALRDEQIVAVLLGQVANWNAVGGPDAPVAVINRNLGRSEVEIIGDFFRLRHDEICARGSAGDNQVAIGMVAGDRQANTYLSLGEALRCQRAGVPIKLLPVQGVAASAEQVRAGNYPLARPLVLVTRDLPTGLAKRFIDFTLSSEVTDLIEEHTFVSYLD
jgi:phosphate transport system substrate-binding protein